MTLVIVPTLVGPGLGCHEPELRPATGPTEPLASIESFDLYATAVERSRQVDRPLVILVVQTDRGEADRTAAEALFSILSPANLFELQVLPLLLDLNTSRNRATAGPLHALERPTLVVHSVRHGILLSRSEGAITADLVRQRSAEALPLSVAADAQYERLAAAGDPRATADFLLAHHNDKQAIPLLFRLAHDESAPMAERVRAWVQLGRSHLWVVEPEQARHAAQALIAELGPRAPEAVAGGNLIRGLQDAKAKRYGRSADEFRAAVAAAPTSPYGVEAAEQLSKLPNGGRTP